MAHFQGRLRVGSVCQGAAQLAFPPPKVGVIRTEPYWAVHVSKYSSIVVLRRLKGCQRVRATHTACWLVDRITLPCDKGGNTKQTHYPQGISGQWRKLSLLKKMLHKSLPSSYNVTLCSLCTFLFFLGFISRQHCVWLLWDHDAYVAAAAIAIRLKPHPTIRVLSAVETQVITEPGYTAYSLLGWGVLGPKLTHRWKRGTTVSPHKVLVIKSLL